MLSLRKQIYHDVTVFWDTVPTCSLPHL
jgi:hypothetical protein